MKRSIEFLSQGHKIRGEFYLADVGATTHTALLLPGFPGAVGDVLDLGQRMSKSGINTLTFNYRGTHGSEGTFSLKNTLEDIHAAYAYLHQDRVMREFRVTKAMTLTVADGESAMIRNETEMKTPDSVRSAPFSVDVRAVIDGDRVRLDVGLDYQVLDTASAQTPGPPTRALFKGRRRSCWRTASPSSSPSRATRCRTGRSRWR